MTATTPRVVAEGRLVRLREKQLDDARRDYEWRKDRELAAYDATRPITMTYRAFVATLSEDLRHPSTYRRTFAIEELEGRHAHRQHHVLRLRLVPRRGGAWESRSATAPTGRRVMAATPCAACCGTSSANSTCGRVYLHTLTSNIRAQHAFRRAGFRRSREVRRDGYDFERMEITREDFEAGEADG